MDSLTEVVLGMQAFTDVSAAWGKALARSTAMWDVQEVIRQEGGFALSTRGEPSTWWDSHKKSRRSVPFDSASLLTQGPEFLYFRDLRQARIAGNDLRVARLTYENPVELILVGSGLLLTGGIMAARFVRDWSASKRIGIAEARKAEAEARVTETWAEREEVVTETVTSWLLQEAEDSATPLPISEMASITSMHNFNSLRRTIERPVTLQLPPGLDQSGSGEEESPQG